VFEPKRVNPLTGKTRTGEALFLAREQDDWAARGPGFHDDEQDRIRAAAEESSNLGTGEPPKCWRLVQRPSSADLRSRRYARPRSRRV
jgi:hypothetical protein